MAFHYPKRLQGISMHLHRVVTWWEGPIHYPYLQRIDTDGYTHLVVRPEPLALPPQNDAVVAFLKSPALSSVPLSFSFPCTLHTALVPFQMPFLQVPCEKSSNFGKHSKHFLSWTCQKFWIINLVYQYLRA